MSPVTHLFASWLIAAKATDNPRDCRLVALAGILPDMDGLGLIVDIATRMSGSRPTMFYGHYHHFLWHGLFAALTTAFVLALFAKHRWKVVLWSFVVFHLHLACDLIGSRGPAPEDLWPIFYFGPFRKDPMWIWTGQWPLDGAMNRTISLILFAAVLWQAARLGHSVVRVFSRKADVVFVTVLRGWVDRFLNRSLSARLSK